MTEDKMIKNLTESAKMEHIRNGIRYLLSGSIEKVVNIHKGNLKYISSLEMDESMEKDEFLEGGAGKLLIKYFKYMYENFPDELSYQFINFPLKYKIYKILGFSYEFVKKDFENNFEIKNKECFWNNCKYFFKYFEDLTDEYIKNYKLYSNNFLMKLGILIVVKNIEVVNRGEEKSENEIKVLDNIFVNYIWNKINENGITIMFERYLDAGNFKKYFQSMEKLDIKKTRKYLEKKFFEIIIENQQISKIVNEGIKLLIMFSNIEFSSTINNYHYCNKLFEKIIKNFKKYDFSQGQKIYLLVNYGINTIFENFEHSEIMYNLFRDTIREDLKNIKKILDYNLDENKWEYSFLLHFLIRENLIDEDEKNRFLKKSEKILIESLKEIFKMKSWKWQIAEFRNLDFLKEDEINWGNIHIDCLGNKSAVILEKKDKIILSLFKYSNMYKKVFQFLTNCIKKVNLFKDLFTKYSILYGIDDLGLIMDELWSYDFPISFINEKYFEYMKKIRNNDENNRIWIKFLHKHEKELYESFENDEISNESVDNYIKILYSKDIGFDYVKLAELLVKSERHAENEIEEILKNQMDKEKVRCKVEEIAKEQDNAIGYIAQKLMKHWNNVKAQEGIENLIDSKDIIKYADSLCLEKHEENAVFNTEVDYNLVRMKDNSQRVPSKLIKYYISEYILSNDIKSIEICNKIEEISQIEDLRKFIEKIFERWKVHKFNPKYKNIFVPLIRTASLEQISEMIGVVDMLVSEYNKIALAAYGIRVLTLRKEVKEIGILLNGFSLNYKDKRIRVAADEALEIIAEREGITRDELNDILVPNFDFEMDRSKIFEYGTKKIKVLLNINEEPQKLLLYDENNKIIKSFPRINKKKNNISAILEKHKKEIKYIKKQLRGISIVQKNSLLKAFFTQRKWTVEKWNEIFIKNPVMQKYAMLLIWKEIDDKNKIINTFRYTKNGTFETINGKEYKLDKNNYINLLYLPEIPDNEQEYWKEYFKDNKLNQPISQLNMPIYKLEEENQEKTEILDYNNKEFLAKELRKQNLKLNFEANSGNDGMVYGNHYYDEKSNITVIILTTPFFPREYSKNLQIEKIIFFKNNVSIQYENILQSQDVKPLKLKEVPDRVISVACYMAEVLIGIEKQKNKRK